MNLDISQKITKAFLKCTCFLCDTNIVFLPVIFFVIISEFIDYLTVGFYFNPSHGAGLFLHPLKRGFLIFPGVIENAWVKIWVKSVA